MEYFVPPLDPKNIDLADTDFGKSGDHVVVADVDEKAIDDAMGLAIVGIRLENEVIDFYNTQAEKEGVKPQTLMRRVLKEFAQKK